MNKPLPLLAILSAILLTACKPETPEDVLTTYLEEVNHGKFNEAAQYVDKNSVSAIAALNMTPVEEKIKMLQQKIDVEVTSKDLKDSIAYLKVKLSIDKKKMPESSFALKKEEGEWKVVMSERFSKIKRRHKQPDSNITVPATTADSIK